VVAGCGGGGGSVAGCGSGAAVPALLAALEGLALAPPAVAL